jgi:hypothetical protein
MARLAGRPRIAGSATNGGALDPRNIAGRGLPRCGFLGAKTGSGSRPGPDSTDPDKISFAPFLLPFQSSGGRRAADIVIVLKNVIVNDHNLCFTWGIGA